MLFSKKQDDILFWYMSVGKLGLPHWPTPEDTAPVIVHVNSIPRSTKPAHPHAISPLVTSLLMSSICNYSEQAYSLRVFSLSLPLRIAKIWT